MDQAMTELQIDPELRKRLNASFFKTADWMRNRGD
jgi:hemoglobin